MAGYITSLSFDWAATWETTIYGSTAPKYCTISIGFTPVHDISPGIDSSGFNRAPVYNSGRIMNGVAGDNDNQTDAGRRWFEGTAREINKHSNKKE